MFNAISIPYILLAILSYIILFIRKDKRLFYSNNFLLAVVVLIIILFESFDFLQAWFFGYVYELFAYESRKFGNLFYLKNGLIIGAAILSLLNFKPAFRKNLIFQVFILVLFIGIALANYSIESLMVAPGWHTIIGPKPYSPKLLTSFTLGIALNLLIVNFKLIPDLRDT